MRMRNTAAGGNDAVDVTIGRRSTQRRVLPRADRSSPIEQEGPIEKPADGESVPAATGSWCPTLLHQLLRDDSPAADERWRRWCADLRRHERLGPADLLDWWTAIIDFDPVLAEYAAQPVEVPDRTVVVAGSGKEQFKTFNVSTAAAVLAAATGTPVVKGISRSVSAVTGAADIVDVIGLRPVTRPTAIAQPLEQHGIAFVDYSRFCPRYAARYDGVFDALNPASFFMPVATICVRAAGFVLGLAHRDVTLAAAAIHRIRPDLHTGRVVSSELARDEMIDEYSDIGLVRLARLVDGVVVSAASRGQDPTPSWRRAVAHRSTHRGNADLVASSLGPGDDTPVTRLVELNAALIITAAEATTDADDAVHRVRYARRSGRAIHLLRNLARLP